MTENTKQGAAAPYAPIDGANFFELPCGRVAKMSDVVELDPNTSSTTDMIRYQEEVRLIQRALGVEPDGKIGPDTRRAARDISGYGREHYIAALCSKEIENLRMRKALEWLRENPHASLTECFRVIATGLGIGGL